MKYAVRVRSTKLPFLWNIVKVYPFKLQAYIWCWMNGYVIKAGRYGYFLNGEVEIIEVCNDR